jgi:hypothetical protein
MIVDSKWIFEIKCGSTGSIDKFKAWLVAKAFSQIQGQDIDELFTLLVHFDFLHLLFSIATANGLVPHQLDVTTTFQYD